MLSVKGIYDGEKINLLEPIPFKGKHHVIVTVLEGEIAPADDEEDYLKIAEEFLNPIWDNSEDEVEWVKYLNV